MKKCDNFKENEIDRFKTYLNNVIILIFKCMIAEANDASSN